VDQVHSSAALPAAEPARAAVFSRQVARSGAGRAGQTSAYARAFAGPAQPVSPAARQPVETATGRSLAHVRVHTGPRVRAAALAAGASAFTVGRDIGIAAGPRQAIPDRLLRHELIHAAQQSGSGPAAPGDAEAQAHQGADRLGALGPLVASGPPNVAFAAEDWLQTTPELSHYGFSELADELRAVNEWLGRQTAGSEQTDRMAEAKAALEAEIARRRGAIRAADRPPPRRRGRAAAPAAPPPEPAEPAEVPRILREQSSAQITDPVEIRAEVDRITAWLQRPGLSGADRSILRQELTSLAPGLNADLNQASAQRQQKRLAQAFSPPASADRATVLENLRMIESIRPYQAQPGMAFVVHQGELLVFPQEIGDRTRADATAALQTAARSAQQMNESTKYRMSEHMRLNYEDQYVVGYVVSRVSGKEPAQLQTEMLVPLTDSNIALGHYRAAQRGDSLTQMADAVFTAVEKAGEAQAIVLNGIDDAMNAAGRVVEGLTITRDLSFAIVLAIGAVLAAPVVAAGVAGTGATGLLATGLTAGGTGLVVGGEGSLLGFASGAGGELAAGHGGRAALRTGLREGERVGKQGVAIGVGSGATLGLAGNLGVGGTALTRAGQLGRGALAGSGGNAIGSLTGAALSDVPEGESRAGFMLRSTAWGAGTGALGGLTGAAASGMNPAARFGLGVALPSAVNAGATYVRTGDESQAWQSAAVGVVVGSAASRPQTGMTPAQQRAFQLGRQFTSTARNVTSAAMIGLANVSPALRLDESPASALTTSSPESAFGQPEQTSVQQEAPAQPPAAAPPPARQQAPAVRISSGAFLQNPALLVRDPFSDAVLGQRSASAQTARSVITGPMADAAEAAAFRAALGRGEIGLQAPTGANVTGGDFFTAEIDADGQVSLIITDVKMSTVGKFPTPATAIPLTWGDQLRAAIAPGRLGLGDPALENAIRAAFAAGRVRVRQVNVDQSPGGQGSITGL
jgi:Domain of unknown function (DUF4157)